LTHDPFGGYGHPDHVRVCEAVTAAFHMAVHEARQNGNGASWRGPQKLYYTAFDKRVLKLAIKLMPLFGQDPTALGRNKDINLVEIASWETPIHARIDIADYFQQRIAASRSTPSTKRRKLGSGA